MKASSHLPIDEHLQEQESIPVGCIPPPLKLCMLQFQWPPPDVTPGDPQMNKFDQVSSDHHQMSLAGGSLGLISPYLTIWGGSLPSDLSHDAFDVNPPPNEQTDTVRTLPSRKRICGW